jgi:hypothetical protein
MKGYLNYLLNNLKSGKCTSGIITITSISTYTILLTIGLIYSSILFVLLGSVVFLTGFKLCMSWEKYFNSINN